MSEYADPTNPKSKAGLLSTVSDGRLQGLGTRHVNRRKQRRGRFGMEVISRYEIVDSRVEEEHATDKEVDEAGCVVSDGGRYAIAAGAGCCQTSHWELRR